LGEGLPIFCLQRDRHSGPDSVAKANGCCGGYLLGWTCSPGLNPNFAHSDICMNIAKFANFRATTKGSVDPARHSNGEAALAVHGRSDTRAQDWK
jgi:hypothetical protein